MAALLPGLSASARTPCMPARLQIGYDPPMKTRWLLVPASLLLAASIAAAGQHVHSQAAPTNTPRRIAPMKAHSGPLPALPPSRLLLPVRWRSCSRFTISPPVIRRCCSTCRVIAGASEWVTTETMTASSSHGRQTVPSPSGIHMALAVRSASMSAGTPCRCSMRGHRFNRSAWRLSASTLHTSPPPHQHLDLRSATGTERRL